jgi:hypothetical protein
LAAKRQMGWALANSLSPRAWRCVSCRQWERVSGVSERAPALCSREIFLVGEGVGEGPIIRARGGRDVRLESDASWISHPARRPTGRESMERSDGRRKVEVS